MTTRYPTVPLGEALDPAATKVRVEPGPLYPTVGVLSFGKGLFKRAPIRGADTTYREFSQLKTGQFVYSRLFAWEGALAVVEREFDGLWVSPEFPVFDIRRAARSEYLAWLCRWPQLWQALRDATAGMGLRRQRVHPDRLLEVRVPLPDTHEQTRVAGRLGRIERLHRSLEKPVLRSPQLAAVALPGLIGSILKRHSARTLAVGELVGFVSDVVRPGSAPGEAQSFVGLQHIESHTGRRLGESPLGGEAGRKLRFAPGDILYGYLRPYLNKVWLADRHGLCSVEQYVLRPKQPEMAPLVAYALRSRPVLQQAIELTHSLQLPRLRSGLLANIQTPWPAGSASRECLAQISALHERVVRLLELAVKRKGIAKAVMPSVLNRAFAGEL